MQPLTPIPHSTLVWNQASTSADASNSIQSNTNTQKIPFVKYTQEVFSKDLKHFWNKHFENPNINSVKELFDKYIWNNIKTRNVVNKNEDIEKLENESKKRKVDPDYWNYRHGLFFTNWPPFSFSEDVNGRWNGCEQAMFWFPNSDRKDIDDVLLLNMQIGSRNTCLLYKEQVECIQKSISKFFSREGVYNNPEKLFENNSTELSFDEGSFTLPSEILPLNWTISYVATKKVSPDFLEELKSGLEQLTTCEREAYLKETLGFSFLVGGAVTFLLFACSAGILHFFLAKKTIKTESDLTEVLVQNKVPVKNYGSLDN